MILELSRRFHGIHSFNSSKFVRQNIQLEYWSGIGHGRGGYDSTESYRYRSRFWTLTILVFGIPTMHAFLFFLIMDASFIVLYSIIYQVLGKTRSILHFYLTHFFPISSEHLPYLYIYIYTYIYIYIHIYFLLAHNPRFKPLRPNFKPMGQKFYFWVNFSLGAISMHS